MRLRRTAPGTNRRRGIILLVVLVMLTLFAIAGLTFVLYANNAAVSGGLARDSETYTVSNAPDMDPATSFNLFLGQLVYGVPDLTPGSTDSALRGHSLAENMYGGFDSIPGNVPSDVPFNGTGRLSEPNLYSGTDGNQLVNYMYFSDLDPTFVRDPSRPGTRANLGAARTTYTGGQNPPYTYADTNCMALASISLAPGNVQVVTPSFYRQSLFDPNNLGAGNPNWTNAQGKYMTLRPRQQDMGLAFLNPSPNNNPLNCDVTNLVGLPNSHPDSVWIDIGAPELYTASGLRYKMLVAPLVLDLDNRINLNAVGNVFATGGNPSDPLGSNFHAGNQAWGAWEVNMWQVLNANPKEWQNVFLGGGGVLGRYGSGGLPTSFYAINGVAPHAYAPGDLNGVNDPNQANPFTPTQPWTLPAGAACFPTWPSAGYGNNAQVLPTYTNGVELYNASNQIAHPMFYDPLHNLPSGGAGNTNRSLPLYSHAAMMYGGPAAAANFDLAKLCPLNFSPTDPNTIRRIHETTLLSMDLDRAGASPYVWDTTNPSYTVFYNPATGLYTGAAPASDGAQPTTFPQLTQRNTTPANSDFDPTTWRSILPHILTRADLDRPLAAYPASGAQPPDRQVFATDLYNRLLAATGMTGVNANIGAATPQQYLTLRWLAQLAVNMVDYIDTDDVMTVWQWTTNPQNGDSGYVYGTELPKLVLNEAYLQLDNDPNDPFPKNAKMIQTASTFYTMNVWAELVNPLPSTTDANGAGANNAVLVNSAGSALYQIVLTKPNSQASSFGGTYPTGLRRPENVLGDPDNSSQPYNNAAGSYTAGGNQVLSVVSPGAAGQVVTPMGSNTTGTPGGNAGYYVVGPSTDATVSPTSYQTPADASYKTTMAYKIPVSPGNEPTITAPTLLLQRLANPNLAYNASTNPYVTVDYVEMDKVGANLGTPVWNDARTYNANGPNVPTAVAKRNSYGRTQPYTALYTQFQKQNGSGAGGQPNTTFYAQNNPGPSSGANDWLVHMDRPLVSPVELAGVSAFKPHELTQQFIDVNNKHYGHIAPWTDPNTRLYRLLEFLKTKNTAAGVMAGGRIPGRININTVDPNATEVFAGLCDQEPGNNFTATDVNNAFAALKAGQSFQGMAPGAYSACTQYPNGAAGINQTILAAATKFQPGTNPYPALELLNKIYNNTTTRSNVFAVWLTVGFFQITDDQTTPMKLGPEVNAAQGKNIRHHMFAIVDRTQITTFTTKSGGVTASFNAATGMWNPVATNVPASAPDARTGLTWNIVPGTILVYDPGTTTEETVVVQGGNTAAFTMNHGAGSVISRGNPGPWTTYNVSADAQVVPYWVIID